MKWQEFEKYMVDELAKRGYWALQIPKNREGSQPFDVIAMKNSNTIAFDCKVCKERLFPLYRIEPNQWSAFELMLNRTNANIGIAAYYKDQVWFINYLLLRHAKKAGVKTISIDFWCCPFFQVFD